MLPSLRPVTASYLLLLPLLLLPLLRPELARTTLIMDTFSELCFETCNCFLLATTTYTTTSAVAT